MSPRWINRRAAGDDGDRHQPWSVPAVALCYQWRMQKRAVLKLRWRGQWRVALPARWLLSQQMFITIPAFAGMKCRRGNFLAIRQGADFRMQLWSAKRRDGYRHLSTFSLLPRFRCTALKTMQALCITGLLQIQGPQLLPCREYRLRASAHRQGKNSACRAFEDGSGSNDSAGAPRRQSKPVAFAFKKPLHTSCS